MAPAKRAEIWFDHEKLQAYYGSIRDALKKQGMQIGPEWYPEPEVK